MFSEQGSTRDSASCPTSDREVAVSGLVTNHPVLEELNENLQDMVNLLLTQVRCYIVHQISLYILMPQVYLLLISLNNSF